MKHYNINGKRSLLLILMALCIVSICCCLGLSNIAYAESQNNQVGLELICKEYTEDDFLYGEEKIASNKISLYENYVNNRFDINNSYNTNANIKDDWILKIVPGKANTVSCSLDEFKERNLSKAMKCCR